MEDERRRIFEGLNNAQNEAVKNILGPSLIIAGAGSGKTKVLTCRIANILVEGYDPSTILALTFTNKASKEMKERIISMVGFKKARKLTMGTFHSVFKQFLSDEAELLGYPKSYSIYDTTDSKALIKQCVKELELDEKVYKPSDVYSRISMAKNNLVTAAKYKLNATLIQNDTIARKPRLHEIYELYDKKCKLAGAMDFDDLLLNTNILFRDFPEALDRIRSRFNFILVDEYQDTNFSQYLIIKKLAQEHGNISVVGDDAQSIYSFRGARIENILNFKRDYPNAREFRLEQNYRSTKNIVDAANSLIAKNKMQLKKKCFSEHESGEKIELISAFTEQEEALLVASSIFYKANHSQDAYNNFAVLYRTNSQSRAIEEALRRKSIPYRVYSGKSFYERLEIKMFLAYLKFISNEKDDEALLRIINFPARGIGDVTLARLRTASSDKQLSLSDTIKLSQLEEYGIKSAVMEKIRAFIGKIELIRQHFDSKNAYDMAIMVNGQFGIMEEYKNENTVESLGRAENIEELFNSIKRHVEDKELEYIEENPEAVELGEGVPMITLDDYLSNVSFMSEADVKDKDGDNNKVSLMTVHYSKGLEFPYVYIMGMEENLFPLRSNDCASEQEMEEERRLFYVALTRAGKVAKLSFSHSRMRNGQHVNNRPSRFLKEIDKQFILNPAEIETDAPEYNPYDNFSSRQKTQTRQPVQTHQPERPQFSMPVSAPNPDFIPDSPEIFKSGMKVEHERFGYGTILSIEGVGPNKKAEVQFNDGTKKILMLKFAKIRAIN